MASPLVSMIPLGIDLLRLDVHFAVLETISARFSRITSTTRNAGDALVLSQNLV